MSEQAYPKDHPAHPDNAGKKYSEPRTPFNSDYPETHPARGGQGQPVPIEAGTDQPGDGFRHLEGLPGTTLAECKKAFAALSRKEQEERLRWNDEGLPGEPEEGE